MQGNLILTSKVRSLDPHSNLSQDTNWTHSLIATQSASGAVPATSIPILSRLTSLILDSSPVGESTSTLLCSTSTASQPTVYLGYPANPIPQPHRILPVPTEESRLGQTGLDTSLNLDNPRSRVPSKLSQSLPTRCPSKVQPILDTCLLSV